MHYLEESPEEGELSFEEKDCAKPKKPCIDASTQTVCVQTSDGRKGILFDDLMLKINNVDQRNVTAHRYITKFL